MINLFKILKNEKWKLLFLFFIFFTTTGIYGYDLSDFGDFSSRSIIMNKLNNQSPMTQEQRDLLVSKKLTPTSECLFVQSKKGNYDNVKLLLEAKVNPNQSYMSEFPIYIAAKENHFEVVKLLYEYNAKLDRGFYSELYEAIRNKNQEMAQWLIDKGARVNYIDSITNNTILYLSLKNNMYDISTQLISKGAKADMRSVKYIKKKKLINLIPDK